MYVNFDSFGRVDQPTLLLCNPGASSTTAFSECPLALGILSGCEAVELMLNFNAPSELNFRINKSFIRADSPVCLGEGAAEICSLPEASVNAQIQLYHNVACRRLIHVYGIGFFMITSVTEDFSSEDGSVFKDVKAESIEVELREKKIPYIADGTYRLFYRSNESQGRDDPAGILNLIMEKLPAWHVAEVGSVRSRCRTFSDVDISSNCLSFLTEKIQEAFDCIVLFDIQNRGICIYDKEEYASSNDRVTSIQLNRNDLVNSLEVTQNADSFYTALESLGEGDISIANVNPLGGNIIYNFSYFYRWFSVSLRQAVASWHSRVLSAQSTYSFLCRQRDDLVIQLSNQMSEVNMYTIIIGVYQRLYGNLQDAVGDEYEYRKVIDAINQEIERNDDGEPIDPNDDISDILTKIRGLIADYQDLLDDAQDAADATQELLTAKNASINEIVQSLSMTNTNNFTVDQYNELSSYIFEGSFKDEYVTITDSMTTTERQEQRQLVYDRAVAYLNERCTPRQEFNLNVGNFIFAEDYKFMTDQLEPGALIYVETPASLYTSPSNDPLVDYTEDIGHYEQLFVLSVTVNYEDCSLSISVGNRFDKSNPKSLFTEIFK